MTLSILITACVGAPEYPGRSEHPVSQAIDIWSLGCVFSLAATWIIQDHTGVDLFHKVRQRAIKKHIEAQRDQTMSHNQIITVSEGDQFHNGREVLDAVTEWHKYLRTVVRKTDTITCRVLDLVDEMMLLGTPEDRIKADDLCSALARIFRTSSRDGRAQLPATLMTILGEIDEEESYHTAESMRRSRYLAQGDSSSSKSVTYSVRKSAFVERPFKTTHRQSIWPDQSLRIRDGKYPEHQGLKVQTVPEQAHFTSNTYPTPQLPTAHHRFPSDVSAQRPSTRSRRSGTAKKHPPQNYFQACEAIEKREHQRKVDKFRFSKKDDLRDGLLMSYFRGKRDIVSIFWESRVLSPTYSALSRSFLWTMPNRWKPIGTKQHNSSKCSLRKQEVSTKMVWTSVLLQETSLSTGRVRHMNLSRACIKRVP